MKNSFWTKTIALAAGMLVLFPSCLKERNMDEIYRPEGSEIIFGVENEFENSETGETRTFFSGDDNYTVDSKKYERIDWVANDKMTISYQRSGKTTQTGNYAVSSKSASNEISNASVDHYGGTKLTWNGGSGDHYFYAMYPENKTGRNSFTPLSGEQGATITGTIPATQAVTWNSSLGKYVPDMNYGFMAGYAKVSSTGTESRVTVPFTPAVTIFEFILKKGTGAPVLVKSATLEATNLTGTFSFKLKGGSRAKGEDWWNHTTTGTDPTTISGAGNKITVTFPSPVTMSTTQALDFTVFALPVAISNMKLTLTLSSNNGETYGDKHLDLNFNFQACKKNIITNSTVPDQSWEYILVHTGSTFVVNGEAAQGVSRPTKSAGVTNSAPFDSYRQRGSARENVNVTLKYAPDNNGVPGTFSTTVPAGLTSATVSATSINKTIYATVTANTSDPEIDQTGVDMTELHIQKLKANGSYGTSSSPQDLSLLEVAPTGILPRASGLPTTANCYIIDRAGWYMFPLVYGNAVDFTRSSEKMYDRGLNLYSYKDAASPASNGQYVWHNLLNYNGQNITSPYILDDVGLGVIDVEAVYIWQDVEAANSFIKSLSVVSKSPANFAALSGGNKSSVPYIQFQVDPQSIRQGNAVIALRKKSDKTILWSWHIWVTDGHDADGDGKGDSFATYNIKARIGVKASNEFLPLQLGYCETGTATTYKNRVWWVRVVQNNSGKELLFRVIQLTEPSITDSKSCGTFYQWGRKDPFLPRAGATKDNKVCHSSEPSRYVITGSGQGEINNAVTDVQNPSKAIQNPHIFYYYNDAGHVNWMYYQEPMNLWNMNQGDSNSEYLVAKTVYDPCPPGFSLPNKNATSNFTKTGENVINAQFQYYNVVDRNGDGQINESDFVNGVNYGWYFYTSDTGSGPALHFPATGFRHQIEGVLYDVIPGYTTEWGPSTVTFWTAQGASTKYSADSKYYGVNFSANLKYVYPTGQDSRAYGETVHPVKE